MDWLPSPNAKRTDRPLSADVRWLAAALGRVIRRLEGDDAYEAVESLRRGTRARRRQTRAAPDLRELAQQVGALSLDTAAVVARAFTLFFVLINTAEQVHRVRRRREKRRRSAPQVGTFAWSLSDLKRRGRHPELGQVTLGELLATWTAHDLNHIVQISRVMARRYRDDVGVWRQYLGVMR